MSIVDALKKLANVLGCCKDTKEVEAQTKAETINYIADHAEAILSRELKTIRLRVDSDGHLIRGVWADAQGLVHKIDIVSNVED